MPASLLAGGREFGARQLNVFTSARTLQSKNNHQLVADRITGVGICFGHTPIIPPRLQGPRQRTTWTADDDVVVGVP